MNREDDRMAPARTGSTCVNCQYWFPFAPMPQVGQCGSPASSHFQKPTFCDKPAEECFVERFLEGQEFMWCQSHRVTIYYRELSEHKGCRVFVGAASLPVEDEAELTLAGD